MEKIVFLPMVDIGKHFLQMTFSRYPGEIYSMLIYKINQTKFVHNKKGIPLSTF